MDNGSGEGGLRPAKRGRPRDPDVEVRVLTAALEEYAERGWAGVSMDGVARRAGVGKSTIYLRWKSKEDLLAAAVDSNAHGLPEVDTGSFRGDLVALAENVYRYYVSPSGWASFRITIDQASTGEHIRSFADRVHSAHRTEALDIIRRAVARGEVRPELPGQVLLECIYGALAMRRMVRLVIEPELDGAPHEVAEAVVEFCLHGLGPWMCGE